MNNNIYTEAINRYINSLEQQFELPEIKNPEEKIKRLQKKAAINYMIFDFERIYRLIFGTQIAFLNKLSISSPLEHDTGIDFIRKQFKLRKLPTTSNFPNKWMDFLVKGGLINPVGAYSITDKGLAFLQYLQDNEYDLKENQL